MGVFIEVTMSVISFLTGVYVGYRVTVKKLAKEGLKSAVR